MAAEMNHIYPSHIMVTAQLKVTLNHSEGEMYVIFASLILWNNKLLISQGLERDTQTLHIFTV